MAGRAQRTTRKENSADLATQMLQAVEAGLAERARRKAALYDGLLGSLPYWVPNPLQREFYTTRDDIIDRYGQEDAKHYLDARRELFATTGFRWVPPTPPEAADKLDALNYIRSIVELGETEGIRAYLGENGLDSVRRLLLRDQRLYELSAPPEEVSKYPPITLDAQKRGGRVRGQQLAVKAQDRANRIREDAIKLLAEHEPHEISGILSRRGYGSRPTVLKALKTIPPWCNKKVKQAGVC